MIVVTELKKPCTNKERADFIVENNHNKGYEIKETDTEIQAWGYTDEEIESQKAQKASEEKELALQNAIEELEKEMTKADLSGDEDWKAELREEYAKLMEEA
jgi:hypothetical protein